MKTIILKDVVNTVGINRLRSLLKGAKVVVHRSLCSHNQVEMAIKVAKEVVYG